MSSFGSPTTAPTASEDERDRRSQVSHAVVETFLDTDGGPEAAKLMALVRSEPVGVHAILFGMNPRYVPFRDGEYVYRNVGAGSGPGSHLPRRCRSLLPHRGVGTGRAQPHPAPQHPKVILALGDELILDEGRLPVLEDPEVREKAVAYGDADELLAQVPWPEGPGWERPGLDATARSRSSALELPRPTLPDSAQVATTLEGYLRLAPEHPDGPEPVRAYDRTFEFDLADAAPFTLEIRGGFITARPGPAGRRRSVTAAVAKGNG